jgi:hypothetical protein
VTQAEALAAGPVGGAFGPSGFTADAEELFWKLFGIIQLIARRQAEGTKASMAERVYIETTVVSYLTARPNRDVVIAGHQQVTHEWWDTRRESYELYVSQLVLGEAAAGDPQAAQERFAVLQSMTVLETTTPALELAKNLIQAGALPANAADDALHIPVAATHAIPYLLTWNCRHLANATMRPMIESVCAAKGFKAPIICTPEELLGSKP